MASGHLGQICPRDGVQRLQERIHSQAPDNVEGVVDGDPQEPLSKRGSRKRAPVHAGQTSHKGNPGVARNARVLLPDFPSIQGIGWLKADSKPQGFQQIRSAPILSDGDTANSHGLPGGGGPTKAEHLRTFEGLKSIRNVGDLDLRDTYFHVAVAQEHTRYLRFAYNGRAFEFLVLPFGLSTAHRGLPQNSRGRHAPVLRRLADEKSVKVAGRAPSRFDVVLGKQAGIPRKRGQVSAHSHSGPGFHGFDPGSPEYACVPERKENPQGYPSSSLFAGENYPAGKDLVEVSRTLVQPPRVGSYGGSPHAADPANAPRPEDTGLGQPLSAHLSKRGNPRRAKMVDVAG